jgi:hypothetical protein
VTRNIRNSNSGEKPVSTGAVVASIAVIIVFAWIIWPKSEGSRAAESPCVQRGIAYFKEIESYPNLSNGQDARAVATERCNRTAKAFDLY